VRRELVLKEGEREFHAKELVVLAGEALSLEVAAVGGKEGSGIGAEVHTGTIGDNPPEALEVETDFALAGWKLLAQFMLAGGWSSCHSKLKPSREKLPANWHQTAPAHCQKGGS
jgi:hypothetical protein